MNIDFETAMKDRLKFANKVAILGIGSIIMSDDAAGIRIAENLQKRFVDKEKIKTYLGNTAPENFTGEIKNFQPDHLIIIDAADLKEKPGSIMIIDPEVIDGISFSTHMLPLRVMVEYLKKEAGCQTTILGVQPENISFGENLSPSVEIAVQEMSDIIGNAIPAA